jgi:hypothetical protein
MIGLGAVPAGALAGGALGQALAARYGPAHGYGLTIAVFCVIGSASGLVLLPKAVRDFRL